MSSITETNSDAETGSEIEPAEPCPTPLAWRAVVKAYEDQSRQRSVERDGRTIDARIWGSGPPLYLVGSATTTHDLFALTAYLLKDAFTCVVVDLPATDRAPERTRVTLDDLVDDLLAVADAEGHDRFTICGASWGGLLALAAAVRVPQRVTALVLCGSGARWPLSWVERILLALFRWTGGRLSSLPLWNAVVFRNHAPWFPPFDRSRWEFYVERAGSIPLKTVAVRARSAIGVDLRDRLSGVTQPVLLLKTEGDGAVRHGWQDELRDGLPNARGEWLQQTGRIPFLTHPHRLAKLIRAFLQDGASTVSASE